AEPPLGSAARAPLPAATKPAPVPAAAPTKDLPKFLLSIAIASQTLDLDDWFRLGLQRKYPSQLVYVQLFFPACHSQRDHAIGDEVRGGPALAHKPVHTKQQAECGNRNLRHNNQRSGQGHKSGSRNPCCSLRCEH